MYKRLQTESRSLPLAVYVILSLSNDSLTIIKFRPSSHRNGIITYTTCWKLIRDYKCLPEPLALPNRAHCKSVWSEWLGLHLDRVHKSLCYYKLFPCVLTLASQIFIRVLHHRESNYPHFKSELLVLWHSPKNSICKLTLLSILCSRISLCKVDSMNCLDDIGIYLVWRK